MCRYEARSEGMDFKCLISAFVFCSLVSCGQFGKPDAQEDPLAGLDAYKNAGGRVGGMDESMASGASVNVTVSSAGITDESDIVWAPEDENVPMPGGLEDLWKAPENKSWHTSYTESTRQSKQSGKPLLIWFTDTAHSPLCRKLSADLFSNSGFDGWASKRLVRLRVDSTISAKEKSENIGAKKHNYIVKLKKRYKVMGSPTVLILSPKGAVVGRYRGYKKDSADYYWSRMKQDVNKAEDDYGAWREKLEKRGYRLWTSRDGRKTFAKLYRFKLGKVILIDPDGHRGTTSFGKLSDADQVWLMLEKKKYEARQKR
jgi:hypothetical protein